MSDPQRLVNSDSRSTWRLRYLLRAARADLPAEDRLQGILTGVGAAVGGANGPGGHAPGIDGAGPTVTGATTVATGLKMATLAKVGVATLLTLGAATGGYLSTRPAIAPTAAPQRAPVVAAPSATAVAPSSVATAIDVPLAASEGPVAASAAPTQAPSAPRAEDGVSEIALLDAAQDALPSDPAAALVLADRHAARFPHGALAQEREVIAIEAMSRLGRIDDARRRAHRFSREFPRSAHWPRIELLVDENSSIHNP
jgi:hypothetical protein